MPVAKPGSTSSSSAPAPIQARLTALFIFALIFGGAVMLRAASIQLRRDDRFEAMSKRQFQSKVLLKPGRGLIVDRNGEPLVVNAETLSLAANPSKIVNKKVVAKLLAKAFDMPVDKWLRKLREKREFIWIRRQLTEAETTRLKKWQLIDEMGSAAPGFWVVKENRRAYPHGPLAGQIVGTVNIDAEGLEGVELWMNERLKGQVASVNAVRDALGRPTMIDSYATKDMREGETIQLTIDASLQFAAEHILRQSVDKFSARSGSIIVMNGVTGELLAMANEPSYNPAERTTSSDRRRNRAITDGYEPGSTLKPILLAAALNNGMKPDEKIFCERGVMRLQGRTISEAETHEKFEWLTPGQIIQHSSNIGAAKIALKMGSEKTAQGLRQFGFGARSGVEFPGEIPGNLPTGQSWQPLTTANVGFGQGLLVTPLQIIRAYAAIANDGWLVQPSLIKSIAGTSPTAASVPRRILPSRVARQVTDTLLMVTEPPGTGTNARLDGFRVAGKTGTAQVVDPRFKTYSRTRYIASFIGFPIEVDPKIVIFTALDEPKGEYYASNTAAPMFREMLNAVVNRFSIPGRELAAPQTVAKNVSRSTDQQAAIAKVLMSPTEAEQAVTTAQSAPLRFDGMTPDGALSWTMPSFIGLTTREAFRILKGRKFYVRISGEGLIREQVPPAGEKLQENASIRFTLSDPEAELR